MNKIEHKKFIIELEAGEHVISKRDSQVLFYITLE